MEIIQIWFRKILLLNYFFYNILKKKMSKDENIEKINR